MKRFIIVVGMLLLTSFHANAELQYRASPGNATGLIYDTINNLLWTQLATANPSSTYTYSQAIQLRNTFNGGTYYGLQGGWRLPTSQEFTNLYNQLPPFGSNASDKSGTKYFGTGPNDYITGIQSYYWTSDYYSITNTSYTFFFRSIPGITGGTAGTSKPTEIFLANWIWFVRPGDVPNYQTYTISFIAGENGSLNGITNQTVNHGGSTTGVTAVPASGYHFLNWTGTNGFVTSNDNPLTVNNVTANQTITANFSIGQNGACGSANGQIFIIVPSTNLCSSGTPSPVNVTGTNLLSWTCTGSNGGSTATCTATMDSSGTFIATGNMTTPRRQHSATLLLNGKVLITGGIDNSYNYLSSAELYDPASGVFTPTGNMPFAISDHKSVLLTTGKVLMVGDGIKAELYDPSTGTFATTGSLTEPRSWVSATLLPNGKVLIVGGTGNSSALKSAELYDPITGTFTVTGSMTKGRNGHSATLLQSGKVLITGGSDGSNYVNSPELYDPVTGTFTVAGSMSTARYNHTATLLQNGKVLVAGGWGNGQLKSAEIYDPSTGTFSVTGNMSIARSSQTANLLPNGMVFIAGGYPVSSAELYNPATGNFTSINADMTTIRWTHTATLLPSGKVLIAGGRNSSSLSSAEIYSFSIDPLIIKGDIDGNNIIDLQDAMLALQVVTNITLTSDIKIKADVNGDNRIGMEEATYIMQILSDQNNQPAE